VNLALFKSKPNLYIACSVMSEYSGTGLTFFDRQLRGARLRIGTADRKIGKIRIILHKRQIYIYISLLQTRF
jgi:hypothetical protein